MPIAYYVENTVMMMSSLSFDSFSKDMLSYGISSEYVEDMLSEPNKQGDDNTVQKIGEIQSTLD